MKNELVLGTRPVAQRSCPLYPRC